MIFYGPEPIERDDDPWPEATAKVAEVNAAPKPEPIEGPPF